jgi:predicted transcriptional regulator
MQQMTKQRRKVQYNLRIDPEMLAWLKEQAEKYDRPVNYMIIHAVKQLKQQQEI